MTFHPAIIDEAMTAVCQFERFDSCDIIIGDNSCGKSFLLKKIVQHMESQGNIYFIDAVNRGFDVSKVIFDQMRPVSTKLVLSKRLSEMNFNIKDTFSCYGTDTERIEEMYPVYEEKVQELFYKLTGDRFEIAASATLGEVVLNGEVACLSSGYQAMIRILLELVFYTENCKENAWVVIDEIDECLSPKYAAEILNFLRREFPGIHYIVATHSVDLVVASENARVIVLEKGTYQAVDADDLDNYRKVQRLFRSVFGTEEKMSDQTDTALRRLLNLKINDAWTEKDEEELKQLQEKGLSASQRLLCRQIEEW